MYEVLQSGPDFAEYGYEHAQTLMAETFFGADFGGPSDTHMGAEGIETPVSDIIAGSDTTGYFRFK